MMELIVSQLNKLGLTMNEAKAYIALLPMQEAKASQIAGAARIPRSKIYETMQSLHKKGFVEILPEKVTRFKAVGFDDAIQIYMENWKQKLENIEKTKEKVSEYLRSVSVSMDKDEIGEFTIVKAKRIIYKKLESFLGEAQKSVYLMINVSDLRRLYYAARDAAKRVELRVLVPINMENKNLIKRWMRFATMHHYETQTQVKIAISDDSETLVFQTNKPVALHSKDKQFTGLLKGFFYSAWESAPHGKDKIEEIETGKPVETVRHIRGRKNVYSAIHELLDKTQKDILINTTSVGIVRIHKYFKKKLDELANRGVRIRCLAPITKNNVRAAKELGIEIRHIDKSQTITTCFDNSYLMLTHIKSDTLSISAPDDHAIVTNQQSTVNTMREMYETVWDNSTSLEARIQELETGKPIEKVEILKGNENIYEITKAVSKNAKKEICNVSTEFSPERAMLYGTADLDSEMTKNGVKVRYVFPVTEKNVNIIKDLMKFAEVRHINFSPIRVRVVDDDECLVRYGGEELATASEQVCMHSTAANYVSTMKSYFEQVWQNAIPAEERIRELETGKPVEKTELIKGVDDVFDNVTDAMSAVNRDVIVCVSDYGMFLAVNKRKEMFDYLKKKGVRIRYITSITADNIQLAKELSKLVELRHFEIPMPFIVTDKECLLTTKIEKRDPNELIRSNVSSMVSRMRELVENIWDIAAPAEQRIREIETGAPREDTKQIRGRENFYKMLPNLISETKSDIIVATSANGIVRTANFILNALSGNGEAKKIMESAIRRGVKLRLLGEINSSNREVLSKMAGYEFIEIRHISPMPIVMTCFDDSRLALVQIKDDSATIDSPEDIAIVTNQKSTVIAMKSMLENMWNFSVTADSRIEELETGQPSTQVQYLRGRESIYKLIPQFMAGAKSDILWMTSASGVKRIYKNLKPLVDEALQRGVRIRCLTQVTKENMPLIRELGIETRHIDNVYAIADCYDDSMLTIMYVENDTEGTDSPEDTSIVTNQRPVVKMVREFIEAIWDQSTDAEAKMQELETGIPQNSDPDRRIVELVSAARRYAWMSITPETLKRLPAEKLKGKDVRILCRITPNNLDAVRRAMGFAQLRHMDETELRAAVVDDSEVAVVTKYGDQEGSVYSNDKDFVTSVKGLFAGMWEKASDARMMIEKIANGK